MILEGIATTISSDGATNVAPMGPIVDEQMTRLIFRPYRTSTTYQNLKREGEGVFHVTDDVLMIATAAIGKLERVPALLPARAVKGMIIESACRAYEFRVKNLDDTEERTCIDTEVVQVHRFRDFFGFNRAKHAVLEAAIIATRLHLLGAKKAQEHLKELAVIVAKTAGAQERQAFAVLDEYVAQHAAD